MKEEGFQTTSVREGLPIDESAGRLKTTAGLVGAIFGLIAVGGVVSRTSYRAEGLKDAPDEFLTLSNETTDFRLIN
jgi:hypothetical protein